MNTTALFAEDDQWIFMQDGARPHTAKATIELLEEETPDFIEEWPANSPDLNPISDYPLIENLWAIQ